MSGRTYDYSQDQIYSDQEIDELHDKLKIAIEALELTESRLKEVKIEYGIYRIVRQALEQIKKGATSSP